MTTRRSVGLGIRAATRTGHEHPLLDDQLEQLLVQHVLAVVQDVVQHVHFEVHERWAEEGGDRVIVGVALVEVALLCEEQQRREGVGIAVELAAVGAELPRTRHHVGARAARRSIEFLVRVQRGKLGRLRSVVRMRAAGSHQALWWRAWEQAVRSYELRKRALLGGA